MSGPRFVDVPADRLLAELKEIGDAVVAKGGTSRCWVPRAGSEMVVDIKPPNALALVRVYTTITDGASAVRACGEDAVRLFVCFHPPDAGEVKFLEPVQKILRTAPQGAPDRVRAFLDRLRDEVRAAYVRALHVPTCHVCKTRPMALRKRRDGGPSFLGCVGYPTCRGTANTAP